MYTTITFLIFLAFFLLYNLSKKSRWSDKPGWASKLENSVSLSRGLSLLLMLISCAVLIYRNGTVSGIFCFIVMLMAMGNLLVLLFPFRYLSINHVILLLLLFVGLEQFIF